MSSGNLGHKQGVTMRHLNASSEGYIHFFSKKDTEKVFDAEIYNAIKLLLR